MEFVLPHYKQFENNIFEIAERFSLNPDKLKIEFFSPNCQVIVVEQVDNQNYKIHINLEDNRIVSITRLTGNGAYPEHIKAKYRQYMK